MQMRLAVVEHESNERLQTVLLTHQEEKQQLDAYRVKLGHDRAILEQQLAATSESLDTTHQNCERLTQSSQEAADKVGELIESHQRELQELESRHAVLQAQNAEANQSMNDAKHQSLLLVEVAEEREAANQTIIKGLKEQLLQLKEELDAAKVGPLM